MAVTAKMFGQALKSALEKKIDWVNDTIKVSLHTSSFVPDQDTMVYQSSLTNECAATGNYATGGATLATKALTYTAGTNVIMLDADDVQWANSTITAAFAVIYDSTPGSAAANPLIAWVDFGGNQSSSSGNFTITWAGAGICTVTAA